MESSAGGFAKIVTALQQGVQALNGLITALKSTYTQISNTTATSATSGSASTLPATPAAYAVVTINGHSYKIALYNP
jgi:hypothetical protein